MIYRNFVLQDIPACDLVVRELPILVRLVHSTENTLTEAMPQYRGSRRGSFQTSELSCRTSTAWFRIQYTKTSSLVYNNFLTPPTKVAEACEWFELLLRD